MSERVDESGSGAAGAVGCSSVGNLHPCVTSVPDVLETGSFYPGIPDPA